MQLSLQALLLSSAALSYAEKHHLFVGAYNRPVLFSLEYDDATNKLRQVNRFRAHAGHPWLSFSHDKQILYGAERDGWASYKVQNAANLGFQSNLTVGGSCPHDSGKALSGRTSVLAEARPPFNVFGSARSACGSVLSTRPDGSLENVVQAINYGANSRIHGMVADNDNNYVYSADEKGNGIWVHQVDPNTGVLVPLSFSAFPIPNASPRRLALHPGSRYLYVLLSKLTTVGVYEVNGPELRYTGLNYSLIPEGANPTFYRGQDILLSADKNILYASARYRSAYNTEEDTDSGYDEQDQDPEEDPEARRRHVFKADPFPGRHIQLAQQFNDKFSNDSIVNPVRKLAASKVPPGYVSAIQLASEDPSPNSPSYGYIGAGWPIERILQVPTSTSGGLSNALVPAPWGNEYFALTDSEQGLVQIWKINGLTDFTRSRSFDVPQNIPGFNMPQSQYTATAPRFGKRQEQGPTNPDGSPYVDSSGSGTGLQTSSSIKPGENDGYTPAGSTDSNAQPQQQPQQQPQPPPEQQPQQQQPQPQPDPNSQYNPQQQQGPPPQDPNQPPPGTSYQNPYSNQGPTYPAQDPNAPFGQQSGSPPPQQPYQPPQEQPYQPPYQQPSYPPPSYPQPQPYQPPQPYQQPAPQYPPGYPPPPYAQPSRPRPRPKPRPVEVVAAPRPAAGQAGLLTGALGGLLGGQKAQPGTLDSVLGTNSGKGLLGGGGLLGLGILKSKKRDVATPALEHAFVAPVSHLRAAVIAEWRAPAADVGTPSQEDYDKRRKAIRYPSLNRRDAALERRQRYNPYYPDISDFGNPDDEAIDINEYEDQYDRPQYAPNGQRVQGLRSGATRKFNEDIAPGSGCCANAIWYD